MIVLRLVLRLIWRLALSGIKMCSLQIRAGPVRKNPYFSLRDISKIRTRFLRTYYVLVRIYDIKNS